MTLNFSFSEETVGYIIDGVMDQAAIQELKSQILEKFETHDKINLYVEDDNITHFSLNAVVIATLFPMEFHKRFDKIALVTNRKWIHALGVLDTVLVGVNIKNFMVSDRLKAISSISEPKE
ncbi:MAG: STAS/SEC14 domain-containing protein [Patiriisocius sp.]|uniref:STAS/SEC14 domain-containing protein n=1 Tax=Patiriisocius sp. TaxID=2822396 RepID=UPI003EF8BD74